MHFRLIVLSFLASLACFSQATNYKVKFDSQRKLAQIEITLDDGETADTFRMPAWLPGDYDLINYGKYIKDIKFSKQGEWVRSYKLDLNTWKIHEGLDSVIYTVSESEGNFSPNLRFINEGAFLCGGIFGWTDGSIDKPIQLDFELEKAPENQFEAPEIEVITQSFKNVYDLLDTPISLKPDVLMKHDSPDGTSVSIAAFGQEQEIVQRVLPNCRKAFDEAHKLFGETAFKNYTFHFEWGGPGGGLEHANGTRIGLWSTNPDNARGIIFHELFHAYNVKRIRPKSLVNPDLTKRVTIDSLWWLEGVTDYYADVLQVRAGLMTQEQLWSNIARQHRVRIDQGRNNAVSALESSQKVWTARGSQGYRGSYYEKGWMIGAVLDMAIRKETENKKSLDDVIRLLWVVCKDGSGYEESQIKEFCVAVGGEEIGKLYDTLVTQPELPDLAPYYAAFGKQYSENRMHGLEERSESAQALAKSFGLDLRKSE